MHQTQLPIINKINTGNILFPCVILVDLVNPGGVFLFLSICQTFKFGTPDSSSPIDNNIPFFLIYFKCPTLFGYALNVVVIFSDLSQWCMFPC